MPFGPGGYGGISAYGYPLGIGDGRRRLSALIWEARRHALRHAGRRARTGPGCRASRVPELDFGQSASRAADDTGSATCCSGTAASGWRRARDPRRRPHLAHRAYLALVEGAQRSREPLARRQHPREEVAALADAAQHLVHRERRRVERAVDLVPGERRRDVARRRAAAPSRPWRSSCPRRSGSRRSARRGASPSPTASSRGPGARARARRRRSRRSARTSS